jgi:hypothetical protein
MSRFVAGSLVSAVVVMLPALPAVAQAPSPGGSHRPLDGLSEPPQSPEEGVSRRLRGMSESRLAAQLAEKLLDPKLLGEIENIEPKKLEQLKEQLGRGESPANDPDFQKLISAARAKREELKLSQDQLDLLRRQFPPSPPRTTAPPVGPSGGPDPVVPPTHPDAPSPSNPATPRGPQQPRAEKSGPAPPPPKPPEKQPWEKWSEDAYRWARDRSPELADRLIGTIGGSQVGDMLRDALRSLGQDMPGTDGLSGKIAEGIHDVTGMLAGLANKVPASAAGSWSDVLGAFRESSAGAPQAHGLSLPTTPTISAQESAPMALWVVVVGSVGFVLWRLKGGQRGTDRSGWRPGRWPVSPGAVTTRHDLVQAFEHLALRCLGPAAYHCNHLELAERIAALSAEPGCRQAATELAALYEQARYAPEEGPLRAEEVTAARRDLCFLAGVAAA